MTVTYAVEYIYLTVKS